MHQICECFAKDGSTRERVDVERHSAGYERKKDVDVIQEGLHGVLHRGARSERSEGDVNLLDGLRGTENDEQQYLNEQHPKHLPISFSCVRCFLVGSMMAGRIMFHVLHANTHVMRIRDSQKAEYDHEDQRKDRADQRIDHIRCQTACLCLAVAMQRLIVKIGHIAPEHVHVGADGEDDTDDDTAFDILQRREMPATNAHAGEQPSVGRGKGDEPVGHGSSAEDDEGAEFTDRIDGDGGVIVPAGHDACGETDGDRDEIGE